MDIVTTRVETAADREAQQANDTAMMQEGYDITDPSTWINTDRAKAFVKALQGKIPDFQLFIKELLDKNGGQ